jgi:hypothetical protein
MTFSVSETANLAVLVRGFVLLPLDCRLARCLFLLSLLLGMFWGSRLPTLEETSIFAWSILFSFEVDLVSNFAIESAKEDMVFVSSPDTMSKSTLNDGGFAGITFGCQDLISN